MSAAKKTLRVLHLASFAGNIGDLANHAGARLQFQRHLDYELSFTELEIREFYWKQRSFNDDFVRYANSFDLLLIGGGNYFELWVESSATGTSIDISPQRLAALQVPTAFYSLGADIGQGYAAASADRFRSFMAEVLARETMFVCVRNDGSSDALKEVLGAECASRVPIMPDGGFFAQAPDLQRSFERPEKIVINIAGDMLERRFSDRKSTEHFLQELADTCASVMDAHDWLTIEFAPHIWRDIVLIAQLVPLIPDRHLRRRVVVSSLVPTKPGLPAFLSLYGNCDLALGMRFHANVCPIGMATPTLGLLTYPQVEKLYAELGMKDRLLDVARCDGDLMRERVLRELSELPRTHARYVEANLKLQQQAKNVLDEMNGWLHACFS
jgi:polysaccharide pyruvyl transferase WcaK-like protein